MKIIILAVSLLLVLSTFTQAETKDTKTSGQAKNLTVTLPEAGKIIDGNPVGKGWVSLIKNLDDWNFVAKHYSLKDGVLQGRYSGGKPHQHAWTKTKYKDFELHAVFKCGGTNYNSGVCIRLNPKNHDIAPGYQLDIGHGYWGCLWEDRRAGMVQKFPKPLADKLIKKDDWNHYYAIVRGHHIQAWLNGVKTIDIVHKKGFLEGSIGFQLAHGKRHTELTVKTLLIKENPKK